MTPCVIKSMHALMVSIDDKDDIIIGQVSGDETIGWNEIHLRPEQIDTVIEWLTLAAASIPDKPILRTNDKG